MCTALRDRRVDARCPPQRPHGTAHVLEIIQQQMCDRHPQRWAQITGCLRIDRGHIGSELAHDGSGILVIGIEHGAEVQVGVMGQELAILLHAEALESAIRDGRVDEPVHRHAVGDIAQRCPTLRDRRLLREALDMPGVDDLIEHGDPPGERQSFEGEALILVEDPFRKRDLMLSEERPAIELVHTHGVSEQPGALVQ